MPTSSQAMILNEVERNISPTSPNESAAPSSTNVGMRKIAPYAIASVYNINGRMILSNDKINDHDALRVLGRASAELFKYHKLPEGYKSIISFDPMAHSFGWKILGGDNKKVDDGELAVTDTKQDTESGTDVHIKLHRPQSSMLYDSSSLQQHLDPDIYERLVQLGFRKSGLELRPDEANANDDHTKRRQVRSSARLRDDARRSSESASTDDGKALRPPTPCRVCVSEDGPVLNAVDTEDASLEKLESFLDGEEADESYRIKPSIHMRKDVPNPRPTSAIFSLRDNEEYAHVDVKYMIEKQIGIKVKCLQFDPLNVRTSKQGVRSRWILEVESKTELDKVINKGLVIGRDKIIIFRFDDIAKREVSSYKYYKSIVDARKRIRGSSKLKLNVNNKLRMTKSEASHRRKK